ncbi:MAG: hypothetical protein RLZZ416_293 [Candidatus Parcubacteria bacterium]|jgi:hypothetical protein
MREIIRFIRDSQWLSMAGAVVAGTFLVVSIANATTTISTNISTDGTLAVTGASTLTGAVSAANGVYASTTLQGNGITDWGNTTLTGTLAVTGASTFTGVASTTTFKAGNDQVSTISGLIFGTCTASLTVTASTSAYANCTGATGVTSSYKVFVQATSSIPVRLTIVAASSTATSGTIQLLVFNTGIGGGDVSSSVNTLNFWAIR